MNTRTYRGREIAEVLSAIKEDHGDEAVIISTRDIGRDLVEVCIGLPQEITGMLQSSQQREMPTQTVPRLKSLETSEPSPKVAPSLLPELLHEQGIEPKLAELLQSKLTSEKITNATLSHALSKALAEVFRLDSKLPAHKKAVAFIGATGVGKTTTIAKLAARLRMAFDMNIGLIAADCFRVGAGFHLQTYASLINLPCRVLNPRFTVASQLPEVTKELEHCDLILIDTAGCNPRNTEELNQLRRDFESLSDVERVLMLPAPSNTRDLKAAVKQFQNIGFERIILSKVDETGFMGPVLNAVYSAQCPIGFLTTGQRVPEDIEPASFKRLAWMLKRTLH